MVEAITLKLNLEQITPKLIDRIETLCQEHQGPHKLKMVFLDHTNRISLNLVSEEKQVQAGTDFVTELQGLGVDYALS